MGRHMSQLGQIEEERVNCMSISIEELDTLDEYENHEQLEARIITYLAQSLDIDIQRCGETLRRIDQKQDRQIKFLRASEYKQIDGHGGNLEILEGGKEHETATAGGPK
ncbi:MAG: hypothetical protein WCP87_04070, partial [Atribacterota bacterium]